MLSERVKRWTEEWKHQGMIEGEQIGEQKGKAEFLLLLLEQRFGPLSDVEKLKINSASSDSLIRWTHRILTAETLNQILDS